MNGSEFAKWYGDYCAAFPQTADYVAKGGKAEDGSSRTLAHWKAVLEPVELDHALLVTARMLSGAEPEVPKFEQHTTPRHVADLAGKIRQRLRMEEPEPATPIDPDREPRYRCLACRDMGMVSVWDRESMRLAARGLVTPENRRGLHTGFVVCSCRAGKRYESLAHGGTDNAGRFIRETPVYYDQRKWCKCESAGNAADVERLIDFMANYKPANYEPAFDAFNDSPEF